MAPDIFADKSQALKEGKMVKQRLLFRKISFLGGERVVLDVGTWEGNNTKSIQIFHSNKGELINHDIAHKIIKVSINLDSTF